jgi:FdhD protein
MIESHLPTLPLSACAVVRQHWRGGTVDLPKARFLAEEVPVAASYDGVTHAVLMMTPDDLEDFAVGFSLTEGIIRRADEIAELEIMGHPDGIVLRMWLSGEQSDAFVARRRRFVGPAGCGMCGLESLAEANRAVPPVPGGSLVGARQIAAAVAALPRSQTLNMQTRSAHAAAFWQPGRELILREDVGRHNALDKLAGALLRDVGSAASGIVVMSSRISIELVQKAGMMGVPILVGISAPTALAVRTAEKIGITLVGIARDDGFEVFSHPERILSTTAVSDLKAAS